MIAVPFQLDGKNMGYIGIDNPQVWNNVATLLNSLAYFVINEITKRRLQLELAFRSYHDALTGLYNRYKYLEFVHDFDRKSVSAMGVVFLDINGLKQINDRYGHKFGDQILINTAQLLRLFFDKERIFRLSSDEFLIFCENLSRDKFVDKIQTMSQHFNYSGENGVSVGYTWEDQELDDLNILVNHANELMFLNKQEYYKNTLQQNKHHNPLLLEQLLNSLRQQEFKVYLQPKADVLTGKIIGAEALVRHHDPIVGIVPPGKFIHVLEKERIIKYVDLFVFQKVCAILQQWKEKGYPLIPISLNFSRITLMESSILDTLVKIHKQYDIPRELIEIEVTESIGNIEKSTVAQIGRSLKGLGFNLSLDDFGSQYTSMAILSIMDLDVLKIDRSLINTICTNGKSRIILKYIIEICRDMNVDIVAEGVETEEQLELLKEYRCQAAQGYLFSKPIPQEEFEIRYMNR